MIRKYQRTKLSEMDTSSAHFSSSSLRRTRMLSMTSFSGTLWVVMTWDRHLLGSRNWLLHRRHVCTQSPSVTLPAFRFSSISRWLSWSFLIHRARFPGLDGSICGQIVLCLKFHDFKKINKNKSDIQLVILGVLGTLSWQHLWTGCGQPQIPWKKIRDSADG